MRSSKAPQLHFNLERLVQKTRGRILTRKIPGELSIPERLDGEANQGFKKRQALRSMLTREVLCTYSTWAQGCLTRGPLEDSCNFKTHMDVNLLIVQFIVFKMNFVRKKIRQASGWLNFLPFTDYTGFKELRIWLRWLKRRTWKKIFVCFSWISSRSPTLVV